MKKLFSSLTLFAIVLGLWAMAAPGALAQDSNPGQDSTPSLETSAVSLASLGEEGDIILRGPYDSYDVRFTPPPSWSLLPGASLLLNLDAAFSNPDGTSAAATGAMLQVSLNDYLISTVFIDQLGEQTAQITIPPEALIPYRSDGRHVLRFFLDASVDCRFTRESSVVLKSNSMLDLPHEVVAPSTDLAILPRPIYQEGSFLPETAALVVPDQPSTEELQAAITVAASFGRMSSGNLALPLVPVSILTEETMASSHLVVVGKPAGLDLLDGIGFVSRVSAGRVNMANGQPDDGVIESAVSPWNEARVVLYVGGNSDAGVVKAAQALSYGLLQPGGQPSQSLISAINPDEVPSTTAVDRTLADLGYMSRSASGYGTSYLEYHFPIPTGQVPGSDPYFNLVYTHSALLDLARSGLVIMLNDQRIGSAAFTEEGAQQVNSLRVSLPNDALQPGDNKLVVQANLRPRDFCSDFTSSSLWFNVFSTSLVHLPLTPAQIGTSSVLVDLSLYPLPFSSDPTMGNVGFVLTDPTSWNIAAQIAADLGDRANGQILRPSVALASAIPDGYQEQYDLIVIGRASEIPLISEMSDVMPAPFESGSDLATEQSLPISYRLPAGASIGYLEFFSSPWNPDKTVLTVLGSSGEGLLWAGNAILDSRLRVNLAGNYAVVNRDQIQTADTRAGFAPNLSATAVPGGEMSVVDVPSIPMQVSARPGWLLPTIIVSLLLTVGLIAFLALRGMRSTGKPVEKQDAE